MEHAARIRRHYSFLIDNIDIEPVIYQLYAEDVLSSIEKEDIRSANTRTNQVQKLLSLIAMKPQNNFDRFLTTLDLTQQRHVSEVLMGKSAKGLVNNSTSGKIFE